MKRRPGPSSRSRSGCRDATAPRRRSRSPATRRAGRTRARRRRAWRSRPILRPSSRCRPTACARRSTAGPRRRRSWARSTASRCTRRSAARTAARSTGGTGSPPCSKSGLEAGARTRAEATDRRRRLAVRGAFSDVSWPCNKLHHSIAFRSFHLKFRADRVGSGIRIGRARDCGDCGGGPAATLALAGDSRKTEAWLRRLSLRLPAQLTASRDNGDVRANRVRRRPRRSARSPSRSRAARVPRLRLRGALHRRRGRLSVCPCRRGPWSPPPGGNLGGLRGHVGHRPHALGDSRPGLPRERPPPDVLR